MINPVRMLIESMAKALYGHCVETYAIIILTAVTGPSRCIIDNQ